MKALAPTPKPKPPGGVRSTEQQLEARIRWTEKQLRTAPVLKHELMRRIKERYGVERQRAEAYMGRARERILLSLSQTKAEFRAASLCTYEGILASDAASPGDKCKAQQAIDELLGLKAPYQSQVQVDLEARLTQTLDLPLSAEEITRFIPDIETRKQLLSAIRAAGAARQAAAKEPKLLESSPAKAPVDV